MVIHSSSQDLLDFPNEPAGIRLWICDMKSDIYSSWFSLVLNTPRNRAVDWEHPDLVIAVESSSEVGTLHGGFLVYSNAYNIVFICRQIAVSNRPMSVSI